MSAGSGAVADGKDEPSSLEILRLSAMRDAELVGSLLATIRTQDGGADAELLASHLGVGVDQLVPLFIELPVEQDNTRIRVLPYRRALRPRFAQFGLRLFRAPSNGTVWSVNVSAAVAAKPLRWDR